MASPRLLVINNANLFAPEHVGIRSLLIGGGKILSISEENIVLPDSLKAKTIDANGRRVVPGYIDCHTHLTGGGGEAGFATQVPPIPISRFTSVGVTTVIGLLGTDDTTRTTGSVLSRVYGLREEGLSAYCWTGGYHLPPTTLTGSAKEDIVYLEPVIGIGEFAISDHRSSQPTFDEFIKLASEAHVGGMITGKAGVLHLHLGDGDRKLALVSRALAETELPARVFHPTHINRNRGLFDEACELVLSKGIHADITAFPSPPDSTRSRKGLSAAEAVLQCIERNVPLSNLSISSDSGGCLPVFNEDGSEMISMDFGKACILHATVRELLGAGLTLDVALPLLTSNVADFLRLRQKGRLAEGKDADLILLGEDDGIDSVLAAGRWHLLNGEQVIRGTFE